MANPAPEQALEQARSAAVLAKQAAELAEKYAEQAAAAAGAATGVDPTVYPPRHLRARDLRRLLRGLVGDAGAAHAADGRHQCDLLGHRRRRAARSRSISAMDRSGTGFGFIALILASVNIFGGFLVTERMLAMYKKKG
jgi:NAD(P) transhydrogenase subunit alpha